MMSAIGAVGLLLLFPFLMAYAASRDLLTMLIPNWISAALLAAFLPLGWAAGFDATEFGLHAGAGFLVLAATFALFAAGVIGGGDAKLAAATAVWTGFGAMLDYLLIASLFGGALTLAIVAARAHPLPASIARLPFASHLHDTRTGIPYGIALAAAGLAVLPQTTLWIRLIAG